MHCKAAREKGTVEKWMLIGLLAVILVLVVCTSMVALTDRRVDTRYNKETSNTTFACVDCSMLTLGHIDDLSSDPLIAKLTTKVENRRRMCCAQTEEQTSALIELVMRRQVPPREPLSGHSVSDLMFSPVSAHKRIYPEHISHDFGDIHVPQLSRTCHFKQRNHDGLEHHRGVVILRKGIQVRRRGLYYIYSSVQFRPQSTLPCRSFDYQTFTHSIHVTSRYVSRPVLKTTYTCCEDCINNQESRYTGGMFLLERGDVIQVKVMEYRLVHFEPVSSFAGLVMMGGAINDEAESEEDEEDDENKEEEEQTSEIPPRIPPFVYKSSEVSHLDGKPEGAR